MWCRRLCVLDVLYFYVLFSSFPRLCFLPFSNSLERFMCMLMCLFSFLSASNHTWEWIIVDMIKCIKKSGTMSALNKHSWVPNSVPRCYLEPLLLIYLHSLIPCFHQSPVPTHQFCWCFVTSLSHWIIYPTFLPLHHSFTAPLLSNHTLICWSERCFLRSAHGKTSASDGSLQGLIHVVCSPVQEQGGVGEGGRGINDCLLWYPFT